MIIQYIRFSILCLLGFLFVMQIATAKPLVLDTMYQGAVKLELREQGLAFRLPKGWQGMAPSSGEGFLASYGDGVQVILASSPGSIDQLKQELAQGSEISPGMYLQPKGPFTDFKDGSFGGEFTLPGAEQAKIYALVKVVKKRSPVITLAVCITQQEECYDYAMLFHNSIKSIAKAKRSKPSGALAASLANKKLYRYYHGSGYSEKSTMTLCADGRYYSSFNASSVSINGTGAMDSNAAGQWNVQGKTLIVRDANGNTRHFQVSRTSDQLLLNQEQWLRENYVCQ